MKRVELCADDFGLSAAVNRGILRLAAMRRLSLVSCLANGPAWPAEAAALRAQPVRAGLHLNLTEGRPLSPALAAHWPRLPALPRLIALAHLRRLPLAAVRAEWRAQLEAFESAYGGAPAHLDGHQHVHHLPQLRTLLLELLDARRPARARDTGHVDGPGWALKRALIAATGGRALTRSLQARGQAQNTRLLGVYDFVETDYRRLMQGWLRAAPTRGALLFCHPGEAAAGDTIAAARARELAYLAGADFAADLRAAGVVLAGEGPAAVDGEGGDDDR